MQTRRSFVRIGAGAAFGLMSGMFGGGTTLAQSAAPVANAAQDNAVCASQALCAETSDFAATVTNFRTSTQGYYKIIDVVVHFQNKTQKPLILGYVQNSGTAVDDRGNRYVVYGANAVRGIGQVAGNSFDPKFALSGGGYGDAQFELLWSPGQQVYGLTFELNLTVDEINSLEANQHTLGGEFPLHYQGLKNGAGAASPAFVASAGSLAPAPCGRAGTAAAVANATNSTTIQDATSTAASAVGTATSAVASIKSLFGHKKSAAAPPASSGASPCPQATGTSAAAPGSTPASSNSASATASPAAASPSHATALPAAKPGSAAAAVSAAAVATTPASAGKAAAVARKPAPTPKVATPNTSGSAATTTPAPPKPQP